jgi:glycosyltransferase involved in cell wall biosynthesis
MNESPEISIVIPIFNEEAMLHAAIVDLRARLAPHGLNYEVILAENGSSDGTVRVARALCARYSELRLEQTPEPNYGRALRAGILRARGRFVLCDEIDLCDVDFQIRALALLRDDAADFVIGSKLVTGASDERPFVRHAGTQLYNALLRVLVDFRGTDTHGLKAFRRDRLERIVRECQVDRDVFASELVVRADRAGLRLREIPVRVLEKRPPSISVFARVPSVLKNLARLTWAIRAGR